MIDIMAKLAYNITIHIGFFLEGGPMGNKQKVTITIDETILEEIDRFSEEHGESRSRLIEEAMKEWKKKKMERELIEGYRSMAKENTETAEANLEAGLEVLR